MRPPADGSTKLSIEQKFYSDFDAWVKNGASDTNKVFVVGVTSDVLQSIGVKSQNVVLRSGTVIQKLNKHKDLTTDTFKGIPQLLESPVIVQFSDAIDPNTGKQKYDSRITVLGELYAKMDVNGEKKSAPVLVALELMPTNRKNTMVLDFNVIVSAYTKEQLQSYLRENSILYIDPNKKRTDSWLSLNRLQLPLGENQYGSIRKITYSEGKVKVQNSTKKTAVEIAYEAAQKQKAEKDKPKFSREARDKAYMEAVEARDIKAAQKMVDQAAKGERVKLSREQKQEVKDNGRREETREAFDRRTGEEVLAVGQKGSLAYAYGPYLDTPSQNAQAAKEGLEKIGVPVFIYEKLETNQHGFTTIHEDAGAAAIPGVGVFIPYNADVAPMEIVGHEGFHYLAASEDRANYITVLTDNIDFASAEFISYQEKYVQEKYFEEEVETDGEGAELLAEEIFAYITSDIHSGDPNGEVHKFLRDYDAVKAAWDKLVEELQVEKAIAQCLNWLGVPDREAAGLALMVQKAGKEDEMLDWLEANEEATAKEAIQAVIQITQ